MIINPVVLDTSHYNNISNWDAIQKFGILGMINKASEGSGMTDKTFAVRRGPATQRGIHYGAYHFLRPGSVQNQVDHFLEVTQPHNDLLLALDHEDPQVPLASARQFCELVHTAVGRYPILYSGFLIKQQLPVINPFWANIRLWLSHYNVSPIWPTTWKAPWLWQFTGDGRGPMPHNVPGVVIGGNPGIDINSYMDTPQQLALEWAA